MKTLLVALVVLVGGAPSLANLAWAKPPIVLAPLKGERTVDVDHLENFTGSCGTAVVRVLGVDEVTADFFTIERDTGRVIVRNNGKETILSDNVLSDINGIVCVPTKIGARLVIWSHCGGSVCSDEKAFTIINPETTSVISPPNIGTPNIGTFFCNEVCARRVLGRDPLR